MSEIPILIILTAFAAALCLGLIFRVFRLLGRPLVTGVVSPDSTPLRGKRRPMIGDYTILSELGRGGMGTVFKATGRQGSTVAIKVIGGLGSDRKAGARGENRVGLIHEARLAASLRHPNIVHIFDVGREKHTLYVVMEYLEGVSLNLYIRNHKLGVAEALRIIAELCDAISYAHRRGIVHRDIKPANVFMTADKKVKVLDFGLACHGDDLKVRPGLAGTLPYMSPEQFSGTGVDARSDLWSTGITLFEILTGRCPFVGADLSSLLREIFDGSVPELPSEVPCKYEIEAILEKALAKNRDSRYQTAVDLAADLRSVILKIEQSALVGADIVPSAATQDSTLPNHASERTITVPKSATMNLGFGNDFRAEVFVFGPPSKKRRFVYGNVSGLDQLGSVVVAAVVAAGLAAFLFAAERGLEKPSFYQPSGLFAVLAALFILVVLGLLCRRAYELVFPPQILRCRSCQGRMRTASDWRRYVWQIEREGFCISDCLTALKQDHWDDAVILFLVHTTEQRLDTWSKLIFLECKSCLDQRAYFWFPIRTEGEFVFWSEAYKFFNPRKAEEFAKVEKLHTQLARPISTQNTVDVHDQITM